MHYVWLLLVAIVLLYIWLTHDKRETIVIRNREWKVLSDYDNSAAAAALLDRTHAKMMRVLEYLKEKYHINETDEEIADCATHPHDTEPRRIVNALLDGYNPDVFYENRPGANGTSYTLNKGAAMYICLRNKLDQNKLVNPDMLLYVMLHEASHIANYQSWGHDTRFWEIFKFISKNAVESGAYRPIDYKKYPEVYCGMDVNYNPIFDKTLQDLS